jgi:hypothetical protein
MMRFRRRVEMPQLSYKPRYILRANRMLPRYGRSCNVLPEGSVWFLRPDHSAPELYLIDSLPARGAGSK